MARETELIGTLVDDGPPAPPGLVDVDFMPGALIVDEMSAIEERVSAAFEQAFRDAPPVEAKVRRGNMADGVVEIDVTIPAGSIVGAALDYSYHDETPAPELTSLSRLKPGPWHEPAWWPALLAGGMAAVEEQRTVRASEEWERANRAEYDTVLPGKR